MQSILRNLHTGVWGALALMLLVAMPQASRAGDDTELTALAAATDAAQAYALERTGVGIVIHIGDDIPNAHFKTGSDFGAALVSRFSSDFGVEAKAFPRPNPGTPATLVTYHIGHLMHGTDNDTTVKSVGEAIGSMSDVVAQFRLIQELGPALAGAMKD